MLITIPIAIVGLSILLATSNKQANYGGIFCIAIGVFPQGPLLLTWATNNSEVSTESRLRFLNPYLCGCVIVAQYQSSSKLCFCRHDRFPGSDCVFLDLSRVSWLYGS